MIVFKGFNRDMTCTSGKGKFQYRIGETATAEEAKVARTGLHAYEEPLQILKWYNMEHGTHCVCLAGGDINEAEDGKIACTELTPIRQLTPIELAVHECRYIMDHPARPTSELVKKDTAAEGVGPFLIVRGKNPRAYGKRGQAIFLLKEDEGYVETYGFEIDGCENKEGWYTVNGYEKE